MEIKEVIKQTPNISARGIRPSGIVLHHTGGHYNGSVSWCLDKTSKVSYHCIVNVNGDRTILAQDNQRAWHAGVSSFKGKEDCNSFMLGIAVCGDTNLRFLNEFETESVALWCIEKMKKYRFGIERITTHREVSPGRKDDVAKDAERKIKERIKKIIDG